MPTKEQLLNQYKDNILPGPLNGIVVLGFCYYVAGPIALQNLVNLGALVIKVERQTGGDPSRHVFSPSLFNSISYNQLSVAIGAEDKERLESLLAVADAIVDNRSIKAKKNDALLQHHFLKPEKCRPQIYCSINGYPNEEINDSPALDAMMQAGTGLAYTNCASSTQPLKIGVPVLDQVTGLLAAQHIIANLYFLLRFPTLPQKVNNMIYISVSMAGVSMWLQVGQVIRALEEGKEIFRKGNQDQFAAPFSYYTAKDGLISVATVNEDQFKRFCSLVIDDNAFYERYSTIRQRIANQDAFESDLNQRLVKQGRQYWCDRCKTANVPASPVLTVSEAIKQDFFKEILSHSNDGRPIVTQGTRHSLFAIKSLTPAPSLGQHGLLSRL